MMMEHKLGLSLEQQAFSRDMRNPHYKVAMRSNMTRNFMRQPYLDKRSGLNSIISIHGKTGSGKTIVMWNLKDWRAGAYGYDVLAEQFHFSIFDFQQSIEASEPGDMPVMDEQVEVFGEGSIQMQSQIRNVEMTVREGEVSMGYVGPELRLHSHHYVLLPRLKLWEMPKYRRHMKVLSWVFDGLKPDKPIGYLITGLPKGSKVDWTAKDHRDRVIWPEEFLKYRKKKHEFIAAVKKGQVSSGSENVIRQMAEKFIEKFESGLPDVRNKKEALAMMNLDDDFKRNLTGGQKDSVIEAVKLLCKMEGIDCGMIK